MSQPPNPAPKEKARLSFVMRLGSSVVLWGVALGIIFAGFEPGFFLLIGVVGLKALWEYFEMLDQARLPNFKLYALICGMLLFAGSFYYYSSDGPLAAYDFELAIILVFILGVFIRQMVRPRADADSLAAIAYTVLGFFYVLWLFNFITKIVYVTPATPAGDPTGHFFVLYLIAVTKFSDMGAYLTGSLIGRHKMVPHISPKKTWEGFLGALGFALFASYLMRFLMPNSLAALSWVDVTLLGLLLGFAAVIGDLAESILKRSTGVKDSGRFLPGIGGALDLVDSLLFTAPLLYFYLRLVVQVT